MKKIQERRRTMSKLPTTPDIVGEPLCIFCSYKCNRGIIAGKPKITFSCPYCCSVFSDKTVLNQHVMTHTKERPHKCTRCEYRTDLQISLADHMKAKHLMRKVQFDRHWKDCHSIVNKNPTTPDIVGQPLCIFCSYRCNKGIIAGKSKIRFCCPYCCSVFSDKTVLNQHVMTHTKERPHKCTRCEYRTRLQMSLTAHMKAKHLMCASCNQAFDTKAQFDRHWKTNCHGRVNKKNHENKNVRKNGFDSRIPTNSFWFNNPTAETATKSGENFENKTNVTQRPSAIIVCTSQSHQQKVVNWDKNFTFVNTEVNTVQKQLSKSKNDDINLCTLCNYNCNRGIVSDDPEINSKALTFDCFHCCSRFLQAKERQDHIMKTHTKERPYKCEDCDFRTESPYILETHHVWQNHVKGYLSNQAFLKTLKIQERWSFFHPDVKKKNKKKRKSQESTPYFL